MIKKSTTDGIQFFEDIDAILMVSTKPSTILEHVFQHNWQGIPRIITQLYYCPQHSKHHPEGNAFIHTMMVIDEAAKYREELPIDWQQSFMWAMLLHDIGKSCTTDLINLTAYDHQIVGGKMASKWLSELNMDPLVAEKATRLITLHMRPRQLVKQRSGKKAWLRLQKICRLDILAYVSMCDSDGRGFPSEGKDREEFKSIMEWHNKLINE